MNAHPGDFRRQIAGLPPEEAVEHLLWVLDAILSPEGDMAFPGLGLTPLESAIMAALWSAHPRTVPWDRLLTIHEAMADADRDHDATRHIIKRLRRKLRPHDCRVVCVTGVGYRLEMSGRTPWEA